jgi:hypothetical protein
LVLAEDAVSVAVGAGEWDGVAWDGGAEFLPSPCGGEVEAIAIVAVTVATAAVISLAETTAESPAPTERKELSERAGTNTVK